MLKYIAKRFVMMLITMFIIITATFFLMRAIPGGPFSFDRVLPPNVKEALEAKYNLDKPLSSSISIIFTGSSASISVRPMFTSDKR